jgi:hypothetical protein
MASKMRREVVAERERAVAGADGDHAARERIEPARVSPPVEELTDRGRARPYPAQGRPHQHRDTHRQHEDDEGAENAGLGHVTLPLDHDRAGPIGEPMQAGCDAENDDEKSNEARHHLPSGAAGFGADWGAA